MEVGGELGQALNVKLQHVGAPTIQRVEGCAIAGYQHLSKYIPILRGPLAPVRFATIATPPGNPSKLTLPNMLC